MGFFSWKCKECEHPMLSHWATNSINSWMTEVIVISPNGSMLTGEYDGYGRVGEKECFTLGSKDEPCCYHHACWVVAGSPTKYNPSEGADDQGFFFNDEHNMPCPIKKEDFVEVKGDGYAS
jgi:hypothetical protein